MDISNELRYTKSKFHEQLFWENPNEGEGKVWRYATRFFINESKINREMERGYASIFQMEILATREVCQWMPYHLSPKRNTATAPQIFKFSGTSFKLLSIGETVESRLFAQKYKEDYADQWIGQACCEECNLLEPLINLWLQKKQVGCQC